MGFETKRALLEHIGKNPSDNKLVDRMMLRGEVEFRDWMYYLVESEEVKELRQRVAELEGKLTWLELERPERSTDTTAGTNTWLEGLEQELVEAKANCDYYKELAEKRAVLMERVIHETYVVAKSKLWNKMEDESDFRAAIIRRAKGINED